VKTGTARTRVRSWIALLVAGCIGLAVGSAITTVAFAGWNVINCGASACYGTDGFDDMRGSPDSQSMYGAGSQDQIAGRDGHDLLDGDQGPDDIQGEGGADTVIGDNGYDWGLEGNGGQDGIYGNLDPDKAWGGADNDDIWGGDGDDVLTTWDDSSGGDVTRGELGTDTCWYNVNDSVFSCEWGGTP
jgi:Ca2+-binding RTX toxin-like protein